MANKRIMVLHDTDEGYQIDGFRSGSIAQINSKDIRGLACELGLSDDDQAAIARGEPVEKDAGWGGTSWYEVW